MHNSTSYSIHGQLTNEVQNGVSIARTYDSLNRPTGYRLMQNAECRMQNDGGGNLANLVNPVEVSYSYDSLGRFASVTAPGGTRSVASANPSTLQLFNPLIAFTYSYDHLGVGSPKLGGSILSLLIHKNTRRHLISNKELGVGCM